MTRAFLEVLEALKWAGVLTWQNRITRIREACTDLFGRHGWCWRVIRTSNAYVFRDPLQRPEGPEPSKSENSAGTPKQEIPRYLRPVLRPRIEAQSIAGMDRECGQPRQAAASADDLRSMPQDGRTGPSNSSNGGAE
jgi:hypothetical protein